MRNGHKIVLKPDDEYKIKYESYEDFENSLFQNVYAKAVDITNQIIKSNQDFEKNIEKSGNIYRNAEQVYNIISFEGTRGTGKTSCMHSFCEFLKDYRRIDTNKLPKEYRLEENINFISLNSIDAGLLEENESIIEVMLAKMIEKFEEGDQEEVIKDSSYEIRKREFSLSLQKLVGSLQKLNGKAENIYNEVDSLKKLKNLSVSQNMRESIKNIVDLYLKLVSGRYNPYEHYRNSKNDNYLVITIDDIDMNMDKGYEALEGIRRYFMVPHVIVLISYQYRQLKDLCSVHYWEEQKKLKELKDIDTLKEKNKKLSDSFMEKVLPAGRRIGMPNINYLIEFGEPVYIQSPYAKNNKEELTLKEYFIKRMYELFDIQILYWNEENIWYSDNLRTLCNNYNELEKLYTKIKNGSNGDINNENLEWMIDYINNHALATLNDTEYKVYEEIVNASVDEKYKIILFNAQKILGEKFEDIEERKEKYSYGNMIYVINTLRLKGYAKLACDLSTYLSVFLKKIFLLEKGDMRDEYMQQCIYNHIGMQIFDNFAIPRIINIDKGADIYSSQACGNLENIKNITNIIKIKKEEFNDLEIFYMFLSEPKEIEVTLYDDENIQVNLSNFNFSISNIFFNILKYEEHLGKLYKNIRDIKDTKNKHKIENMLKNDSLIIELNTWRDKYNSSELLPLDNIQIVMYIYHMLAENASNIKYLTVKENLDTIFWTQIREMIDFIQEKLQEIDKIYGEILKNKGVLAERFNECTIIAKLKNIEQMNLSITEMYSKSDAYVIGEGELIEEEHIE